MPQCGAEAAGVLLAAVPNSLEGHGNAAYQAVMKILPNAKVVRVDGTDEQKHLFRRLNRSGRIDILVGTQMIAKGLDYPDVTLVGLVDADLSLHIPTFGPMSERFSAGSSFWSSGRGLGWRSCRSIEHSHADPIQFARHGDVEVFCEWN